MEFVRGSRYGNAIPIIEPTRSPTQASERDTATDAIVAGRAADPRRDRAAPFRGGPPPRGASQPNVAVHPPRASHPLVGVRIPRGLRDADVVLRLAVRRGRGVHRDARVVAADLPLLEATRPRSGSRRPGELRSVLHCGFSGTDRWAFPRPPPGAAARSLERSHLLTSRTRESSSRLAGRLQEPRRTQYNKNTFPQGRDRHLHV